jgi:hypothetical protein
VQRARTVVLVPAALTTALITLAAAVLVRSVE